MTNWDSSAARRQSSKTANRRFESCHPSSQTANRHPEPPTCHPKLQIVLPNPATRHPKPPTCHPRAPTRHPAPQTVIPEPRRVIPPPNLSSRTAGEGSRPSPHHGLPSPRRRFLSSLCRAPYTPGAASLARQVCIRNALQVIPQRPHRVPSQNYGTPAKGQNDKPWPASQFTCALRSRRRHTNMFV